MAQSREDRIFRHYLALRTRQRRFGSQLKTKSALWMTLARHWKMPVGELKEIVATYKDERR